MNRKKSIIGLFLCIFMSSTALIYSQQDGLTLSRKIKLDESKEVIANIGYIQFDSTGKIYLADWSNIRKYDESGKFLGTIIKKGNGPNELTFPASFQIDNDANTLMFYDEEKTKIIFFDLDGKLLKYADPPNTRTEQFIAGKKGDYYVTVRLNKKDECLIYRLDKNFKVRNCFFNDPKGWDQPAPIMPSTSLVNGSNGDLYVVDILTYKIFVYDGTGKFIKTFADPGPEYKLLSGDRPKGYNAKEFFKWLGAAFFIGPMFILENNRLIVFYFEIGHKRGDIQYFYDIYNLEGKKTRHGALERGMGPKGTDNHGRLVCAKPDISGDGIEVTNWLYVYSLQTGKK